MYVIRPLANAAWFSAISQPSPSPRSIPPGVIASRLPEAVVMLIISRARALTPSAKIAGRYSPQAMKSS